MSWRDVLPIHPAAKLFPRMTPDELKELGADIVKNEQRVPIAIIERSRPRPDGTFHISDPPLQEVLDGISRLDAMEEAGIAVTDKDGQLHKQILRTVVDTDEVDPVAFVISANIHRRHLTGEQKRDIVAALLKDNPQRSNNATAKIAKVDDKTVGAVRAEMEARSEIPNVSTRTDSKGRNQPSRKTRKPTTKPATDKPKTGNDVQAIRDAAATRVQAPVSGQPEPQVALKPPADDIGPNGVAEAERLRVRVEELQAQVRQRDITIEGLRRDIAELQKTCGDPMSVSEFQAAIKKWEDTVETQRGIIARLENENANLRAGFVAPRDDGLDSPNTCGGSPHDRRHL
jgi:hypothetical protein